MTTSAAEAMARRAELYNRQMDALSLRGISAHRVFTDKATGANFERPGYTALLQTIGRGDLVVIASIDRLGRDYDEIQEQWRYITKVVQADVEVLDMPLLNTRSAVGGLTGTFLADIVLQVMCYLAQMERDRTKERQREGIVAAKARGVKFGHPNIGIPRNFAKMREAYETGERTREECARALGVSVSTFDRWRRGDGKSSGSRAK